jgi:predicted ester cyclase
MGPRPEHAATRLSEDSGRGSLRAGRRAEYGGMEGLEALSGEAEAVCYAEDFADHVNGLEFHGLEGVRRPTALYRALFEDLVIEVVDQVAEADRVASRWTMRGSNRGRSIELTSITISRLHDGRIVEDWTAADGIELLRRLGLVRVLRAAPRLLRTLREAHAG